MINEALFFTLICFTFQRYKGRKQYSLEKNACWVGRQVKIGRTTGSQIRKEVSLEKVKEKMTEKGYDLSIAADWSSAGSAQA